MTDTASIITELRKEAGYTQKSLAEALNITDKAVSKWERGLCMPDVALLPKLSLLLDADIELLLGKHNDHSEWAGLIDLRNSGVVNSQLIYDKPLVYYLLCHYLLLDIRDIRFICDEENKEYLSLTLFREFGFNICFEQASVQNKNLLIMPEPVFLFGSDLTRKFQGAMASDTPVKLVPEGKKPVFIACPAEYTVFYEKNPDYLLKTAAFRTLGRGMVCLNLDSYDRLNDAANFVRMYQNDTGLMIGSLEEIAFRKGILSAEQLRIISGSTEYGEKLRKLV